VPVLRSDPAATRFGIQPARGIIFTQGLSQTRVAREIGVGHAHLHKAVLGVVRPCPEVRERLPKLLNCKLEDLFTPEALARDYLSEIGRKSTVKR
jgi:transcriptional regulator with XRE-family HTH domain